MDASGYNMLFNKERLAILCANHESRLDSLADENAKLKAENDKLRELAADMHRGICIAYLRGRPLDPYQYESRMRELVVGVD